MLQLHFAIFFCWKMPFVVKQSYQVLPLKTDLFLLNCELCNFMLYTCSFIIFQTNIYIALGDQILQVQMNYLSLWDNFFFFWITSFFLLPSVKFHSWYIIFKFVRIQNIRISLKYIWAKFFTNSDNLSNYQVDS